MKEMKVETSILMERFLTAFSEEELEILHKELKDNVRNKLHSTTSDEDAIKLVQELKVADRLFGLFREYANKDI